MRIFTCFAVLFLALNEIVALEYHVVFDAKGRLVGKTEGSAKTGYENFGKGAYFVLRKGTADKKSPEYKRSVPALESGRTRWYEAGKNEHVKICPSDSSSRGIWLAKIQAEVDSSNCLCVFTDQFVRSVSALYIPDTSRRDIADTSWILIGQKIAPISEGTHRFFEGKEAPLRKMQNPESGYRDINFSYDLIVDAMEFRVGDAEWLIGSAETDSLIGKDLDFIDERKLFNRSSLSMETSEIYRLANARSARDGLDSVYRLLPKEVWEKSGLPFLDISERRNLVLVLDTSANGYRVPFFEEWAALQRAGGSGDFFWGNDYSLSGEVVKYEQLFKDTASAFCRPSGQKAPNPYGLYDVYGNALEYVLKRSFSGRYYHMIECQSDLKYDRSPVCSLFFDMVGYRASKRRKICIGEFDAEGNAVETCTPYMKRTFVKGFRLVRKLR